MSKGDSTPQDPTPEPGTEGGAKGPSPASDPEVAQPTPQATEVEPEPYPETNPSDPDETVLDRETVQSHSQDPVTGEPGSVSGGESRVQHPETIGPFRIVDLLGEGGMGAVYLAEQSEPVERQVALKLVHASLRSPTALARFTAERQAMARLSHPHIAQLYEAGTTEDGFPYFAMEYVRGETLTRHCDQERATIGQRLDLFVRVCRGVQHAHQKGILHRDLKPSNILVAEVEGRPQPKVIDFGIAKAVDEPLTDDPAVLTRGGAIGTPAYMSPEALTGSADIDTRTDVYSLGIVLYELLAGVRPRELKGGEMVSRLDAGTIRGEAETPSIRVSGLSADKARKVAEARRLTASELTGRVRGDLDWIVMRAIADESERRYASVAGLAADIERHLADQPVEARPPTTGYRMWKLVRRHRVSVAAAALVAVALFLGIVGTTVGLLRARQAEREALAQADRADREAVAANQVSDFLTDLFEVSDPGQARGNTVTARELLDKAAESIAEELEDQPLVQAQLMRTIGEVYSKLGLYAQALPLLERAFEVHHDELPADHPELATSLFDLGTISYDLGRYDEAERYQKDALAIREKIFEQNHPVIARNLNNLGNISYVRGRYDEAERYHRHALAIREEILEPDHPDIAQSLNNLGIIFHDLGRYGEAEEYHRRALAIREQVLEPDHPDIAASLTNLGLTVYMLNRYEEAERYQRRALAIHERVLEPGHPLIAGSLSNLGNTFYDLGRYEDAATYHRRALAVRERTLGPDHPDIALSALSLGLVAWKQGHYSEAENQIGRALEIHNKVLEPDHPHIAYENWSLGNVLCDQGRYEEGEASYRSALGPLERTRSSGDPFLVAVANDYAKLLRKTGREAEAVALEARVAAPDEGG